MLYLKDDQFENIKNYSNERDSNPQLSASDAPFNHLILAQMDP